MKVKIVKCKSPSYWYADKVGHVYRVLKKREPDGAYIRLDDCHVIDKDDCRPIKSKAKKVSGKMKEGYYLLKHSKEKPILVYGYYCTDLNGEFVFGFNTHDGGGLVKLSDLARMTKVVKVKLVEVR